MLLLPYKVTLFSCLSGDRITKELLHPFNQHYHTQVIHRRRFYDQRGLVTGNLITNHSSAFAYFLDTVHKHAGIALDQMRFICRWRFYRTCQNRQAIILSHRAFLELGSSVCSHLPE